MYHVHQFLLSVHIGVGAVALIAFWLPVATRKGSRLHRQSGKLYRGVMTAVTVSAILLSGMGLVDPLGARVAPGIAITAEQAADITLRSQVFGAFLLMLGLLVLSGLQHGVLALRTRDDSAALRSRTHLLLLLTLGLLAAVVLMIGISMRQVLLIVFAVLALSGSVSMLREAAVPVMNRNQRLRAHFGGLIGTGIGAYTAFFAFGGSRLLGEILPGQWQVVPWVIPAIVGTLALRRLERHYPTPAPEAAAPSVKQRA